MKLNLEELRIKLNQLTERIISRLKDRSRYKLNAKIYQKNALPIKNRKNISFFKFALEGLENYHASLGRYKFPDQYPISQPRLITTIKRKIPFSAIIKVKIDFCEEIIKFYLNSLKKFCPLGNDSSTYGETVYCDADIVELLNERINLGRFVAQSKLKAEFFLEKISAEGGSASGGKNKKQLAPIVKQGLLRSFAGFNEVKMIRAFKIRPPWSNGHDATLEKKLRNLKREREIIKKAKEIARKYTFPLKITEEYFKWIIKETIKIEIEYLKKAYPQILSFD